MEIQEKNTISPFVFVLNDKRNEPILACTISGTNYVNLNQNNLISIPTILGNSLNLINDLRSIFTNNPKKIVLSACKTEFGTVIVLNDSNKFDQLPIQFITDENNLMYFQENFDLSADHTSKLQADINKIIISNKKTKIKQLEKYLIEMYDSLKKYFSFISVFNNEGECIVSTIDLNVEENTFAKQVYSTITENESIRDIQIDLEDNLSYKQLGEVLVFYFYLNGLYFYFFCISPKINPGITKLKLSSYIKSNMNDLLSHIQSMNNFQADQVLNDEKIGLNSIEKVKITFDFE